MQRKICSILFLFFVMSSFAQHYKDWEKHSVDIYTISNDQNPSMWEQVVLKEVNGVFYKKASIDMGKYRVQLLKVKDQFFQIRGTDIYLDIKGYLTHRSSYYGVLEIDAMVVNSPSDNSPSCVGTIERLYLEP